MILEITRKRLFLIGSFIVVMFAIPLTVYITQKQQEVRSRAAEVPDTTVVAVFNGEQITKGQVRDVAEEQNDPSSVDAQALKDALIVLAERKILDLTAEDLGIGAYSDRVNILVENEGFSEEEARYEVLRDQIILAKVKSREATSVEFWNPPQSSLDSLTAEEKENARKELSDGIPALNSAVTKINAGTDVIDVGKSILVSYPSLKPVLAVNGYILDSLDEAGKIPASLPQIYEFGDSSLDQTILNALFSMGIGEVKSITNTSSNRGGTVFRLVSKGTDSGELSYEDWLDKQKSDLFSDLGVL